jgi:ABC-type Fe3+-hydroxamate transport system substrate-binding protein
MLSQVFTDQCGNRIHLPQTPARIISLVPSQTELLFQLGLEPQVVGITRYCVHPTHWKHEKTLVGGTKTFDFEAIENLQPDLIIGNKEENYKEGIELLQSKYPVWMSDIYSLDDAFAMMESIGAITSHHKEASKLIRQIKDEFLTLRKFPALKVLYLIWRKPWMAAASDTFIHHMLKGMGLQNSMKHAIRYPELTSDEIRSLNPDIIFLSSEPFPFADKHIREIKQISPASKVILVDGEMFSWYGSRLLKAPAYFNSLSLDEK